VSGRPTVATAAGEVRGRRRDGVDVFLGIPYAAPPVGAARFAPPRPHAPWHGVRDATDFGPTAPQPRRDVFGELDMSPYFGPGWVPGEDHLTLNVWAPADRRGPSPVAVFVHGGGFVAGSSSAPIYDGAAFARDGVVLVTVGYRLGVPGFLHLPDAPDNRGALDVIAALRWVRDTIAGFGGDPGAVTLFGQSAGATTCAAVLADPRSEGLVRRAVLQSGSGTGAFTRARAGIVTAALGDVLGAVPTAAALAGVPDADLVAAVPSLSGLDLGADDPLRGLSPFSVVSDEQPADAIAHGRARDVDLLVGTTSAEGNLYLVPTGKFDPADLGELRARSAALGDALFGDGTRRVAAAHGRAHVYEFTWASAALGGLLGATHAVELPFVFDTVGLPALHGPRGLLGPVAPPPELAARTHGAWVRFVRTGDPGWPRENGAVMRIGDVWEVAGRSG
jgi:para-nitrobenzyl esterase